MYFPSLARYLYDNVICLFRAALPQNWRLTCINTFTGTLMFAYPFWFVWFFVLRQLYGLCMISFDENSFSVPTTNNLNRTFLLVHYPFFNILKFFSGRQSWVISTPGIHTGTSTSMHICHDIITSILWSKTFWLVSWLYYCFTALWHILGHFKCGQLANPHCSWASLLDSLPVLGAHSLASNWQLPFLNQRKGENGRTIFFITKSPQKNVSGVMIEPATVCMPGRTRIRPS